MNKNHYDIIVIGGGASGMMAAGRAAELGKSVLLLEKNKALGQKLKITGGGRCNVTNGEENTRTFLKNYSTAEQFLYSPFSQFGNKDTFEFFEKRGLPLVIQARKRAFPHTEKSLDVYKVMEKYIKNKFVTIKTNSPVVKILKEKINIKSKTTEKITGVKVGNNIYTANSYILATGGMSHPETGSTGDGFDWLRDLGHTVKAPTPTIVPLAVADEWIKSLAGVSLSFMKITFYADGVKKFSKTGKLLFTHFGLSGPLILNSSSKVNDLLYSGIVTAKIDAYPDTNEAELEKKIIKVFDENKNKILKNVLDNIVPHGTISAILTLLKDVDGDTKIHSIKKEARKGIVALLKALPVTITGLMGFDRAVVADGGVELSEVDMRTMRSKLFDNLYITGDLLHINRPSGGFSLQICWTSGYIAGTNA
jgi:predicted Rossmann fold flavoprotein